MNSAERPTNLGLVEFRHAPSNIFESLSGRIFHAFDVVVDKSADGVFGRVRRGADERFELVAENPVVSPVPSSCAPKMLPRGRAEPDGEALAGFRALPPLPHRAIG